MPDGLFISMHAGKMYRSWAGCLPEQQSPGQEHDASSRTDGERDPQAKGK